MPPCKKKQLGNNCSFHAISAAVKLLLGEELDPEDLAQQADRLWWRGRWYRIAPGWAVTPRMQVRYVRYLAKKHQLPITAALQKSDPESLLGLLTGSGEMCIPIITIIWLRGKAPPIYLGDTKRNFNHSKKAGAHSMILAAYDPEHRTQDQFSTPWGFINPWLANTTQLFWMRDADFQQAWRFKLPCVGPNPLVVIKKTEQVTF